MAVSTRRTNGPVLRSHSPSGRFHNSPATTSFASTTSAFSSRSTFFQNRSSSPTPVSLYGYGSPSASTVRFSFDNRSISPSRSISSLPRSHNQAVKKQDAPKKTCMCSPTSHPGSFRCSLHKNTNNNVQSHNNTTTYPSNRLNARRSAMTNSLVRIGTVEGGDLVKRALAALIRPSSHQQRRRMTFQARPSRLSVMSTAEDV
ncbi:hypothetical protein HanRHA438_Chr10g0474151 [Helianthus annuus]|uniref:Putative serine-rich protein-related protein n=1 Tax=Helianthus annuus TaxID=4232 RepID=A0A251TNZ5_HELAN|nr:putative protein TPRXL [Helianthus annuus]KAF5788233.1 hypothetical protein HanXRQr2_Chr10g0461741 [Helianthus annuus]KAJ0515304.1 hypothetical protein HanHA300_Chr10g0379161 [Helianthus annuus]KAJ0531499.1 hypothetical protein HanHA89_Chr10g0401741 [Helianthus annuus]KAJ0698340.1 hypothetical protein HanLR1_Chr10g0378961 [Helianthus annuus]KAJ0881423.1 hypothetical protein HanRHA438_Chr10g0474151 [Helianthus annuus]